MIIPVNIKIILVSFVILAILGCNAGPVSSASSPLERFRNHLETQEYHEAFLIWPEVEKEMKDVQESACGFEFFIMIDRTAYAGQKDWRKIFMDRRIPKELKYSLLEEIQENVDRGIYDKR